MSPFSTYPHIIMQKWPVFIFLGYGEHRYILWSIIDHKISDTMRLSCSNHPCQILGYLIVKSRYQVIGIRWKRESEKAYSYPLLPVQTCDLNTIIEGKVNHMM